MYCGNIKILSDQSIFTVMPLSFVRVYEDISVVVTVYMGDLGNVNNT